jgi:hypothetical protein
VNWQHLKAFIWLRWRLRFNQVQRSGTVNAVILVILAVGAVCLAVAMLIGLFFVGLFLLPLAPPEALLLIWDGVVLVFLFAWCLGILTELQRSEALSLTKFLHLPVSLTSVFLINYLSSLVNLILIVFAAGLFGLVLGEICARGPALLLVLPLLAAFFLMVTALTYQFQGWLAALMVNQRRRRTVIVVVTALFILLSQLPNLINILQPWRDQERELSRELAAAEGKLKAERQAHQITADQFRQRQAILTLRHQEKVQELEQQTWAVIQQVGTVANVVLPPGWLALGATAAEQGDVLPALLGTLGMLLIGTVSLWRSYRTTVRLYTGQFASGEKRRPTKSPPAQATARRRRLLEARLPWVSEQASAIALSNFCSLARAPEVKLILLTPCLMVLVFGAMAYHNGLALPAATRPLAAYAGLMMVLLSMVQLVGNQFGFDRSGFRVFVLCPAPRGDILLGKNLACAPMMLGLSFLVLVLVQVVYPLRWDHLLAMLPQLVSMYLLFCLVANSLSILAPVAVAAGSLKMSQMKGVPLLLHMAFVCLFPMVLSPTLLPFLVEVVLDWLGWANGVPLALLLALAECAGVVILYRRLVDWQGGWLQAREQKILETVASRAE